MESEKKTCSTCRHWVSETCRASSPAPAADGYMAVWPATRPTDYCGRHSVVKTMAFLKTSRAPEHFFQQTCEAPLARADLITAIGIGCKLTRNAAMSRIQTLVRHGKLREGRDEDGDITLEWVNDSAPVVAPRQRLTAETILPLLGKSESAAISLRALHRKVVAGGLEVSLTTVLNVVNAAVDRGAIAKSERGLFIMPERVEDLS